MRHSVLSRIHKTYKNVPQNERRTIPRFSPHRKRPASYRDDSQCTLGELRLRLRWRFLCIPRWSEECRERRNCSLVVCHRCARFQPVVPAVAHDTHKHVRYAHRRLVQRRVGRGNGTYTHCDARKRTVFRRIWILVLDHVGISDGTDIFGIFLRQFIFSELNRKHDQFIQYLLFLQEFLSAGVGFVLYALVLLRVRGNLTTIGGRWRMRWIPRSQAWQLSIGRDMLDSAMLRVAANMVW